MADATMAQLNAAIHRELETFMPEMKFRIPGVPYKLGEEQEWIEVKNLSRYAIPTRKDARFDRLYVEVLCYAFEGQYRTDHNWNRVWEIADIYSDFLCQRRISVESSCIQFKETRSMFLDPRALGDFAKNIDQASPLLHVQCIALGCEGLILKPKE